MYEDYFDLTDAKLFPAWGREHVYLDTIEYCLSQERFIGNICEFGVADGLSINHIAKRVNGRPVFGFDSFEGLREDWRIFPKGYFKTNFSKLEFEKNVVIYKGYFDKTIPLFLGEARSACSFINVDCDLYSSTVEVLEGMNNLIVKGTIIYFDEVLHNEACELHEKKAMVEWINKYDVKFKVLCYNDDMGMALEILDR